MLKKNSGRDAKNRKQQILRFLTKHTDRSFTDAELGAELSLRPGNVRVTISYLRSDLMIISNIAGHADASAINKLSDGLEFCAEKLRAYDASRRAREKSPKKSKAKKRGTARSDC